MDSEAVETLSVLLQRVHVLAAYRDGPASRATIAERAGCSRATVYRAEQYLDAHELIEPTPNGVRITGAGESVIDQFQQCHDVIEAAMQLRPLLEHVESHKLVGHLHLLADAELIEPEPPSPYHIEHRVRSVIEETQDRMVGMTTGLGSPTLAETMFDRVEAGVSLDWILPTQTLDDFSTENSERAEAMFDLDRTAVRVLEEVPLELGVYDERLLLFGFDDSRGVLEVVAITDDLDALEWALEVMDGCQSEADRIA